MIGALLSIGNVSRASELTVDDFSDFVDEGTAKAFIVTADAVVKEIVSSSTLGSEVVITDGKDTQGFTLEKFKEKTSNASFRDKIRIIKINGWQTGLSLTNGVGGVFQNVHTIIGNEVRSLAEDAFGNDYFPSLQQVYLPDVVEIGAGAFEGTNLHKITINTFQGDTWSGTAVTSGVQGLFQDQTNLTDVICTGGLPKWLPADTFSGCTALKNVDLSGVRRLAAGSLAGTTALTSPVLNLHGIDVGALTGSGIKELHLVGKNSTKPYGTARIHMPHEVPQASDGWVAPGAGYFAGSNIETLEIWTGTDMFFYDISKSTATPPYNAVLAGMTKLKNLILGTLLLPDAPDPSSGHTGGDNSMTSLKLFGDANKSKSINLTIGGRFLKAIKTVGNPSGSSAAEIKIIYSFRTMGDIISALHSTYEAQKSIQMPIFFKDNNSENYPTLRNVPFLSIALDLASVNATSLDAVTSGNPEAADYDG
jgi:hypothetical protein